jgi:hypothetical protein
MFEKFQLLGLLIFGCRIAAQFKLRHSNTPLAGRLRMFFGIPRKDPAEIRKPVEITQNLRV